MEETGPGYLPARPQKGGIQEVWSVSGSDHEHVLRAVKPVQLGQELGHHSVGRGEAEAGESMWRFFLKAAAARPLTELCPTSSPTQLGLLKVPNSF